MTYVTNSFGVCKGDRRQRHPQGVVSYTDHRQPTDHTHEPKKI